MKFTNVKKWLSMLLVVCSMLSLAACGKSDKDPAGDDSEKGTKVAVVFASSGLGDKSFNDALYDGMKKAESTMGIQWVYSEPKDDAEYEGLISGYADSGDCDLIICLGGSQSSSLENVAPNYPQQKFVILDAVVEGDNIRSYTWRDQELGFLAGFLGASLSDTNTLGYIGAHDIPLCNLGAAGMIAGAHYANPDCQVLVDYANGWAEVNGCYELAITKQGLDENGNNPKLLNGVEFKLEKLNGNSVDATFEAVNRTTEGVGGNAGKCSFTKLSEGSYRLTELKTVDGYNLLAAPIEFTLQNGKCLINGETQNIVEGTPASGYTVSLTINNRKGFTLPHTGADAPSLWLLIGLPLLVAGLLVLVFRYNRKGGKRS